jgi:murein DD-endopeptidase MepM/ murein hydrolase activator NlpD
LGTLRPYPHTGIDIAADPGQVVIAVADGVVGHTGFDPPSAVDAGCGLQVYVDHAEGHESRYCHLSEVTVHEGEPVKRGQVVGRIGLTGETSPRAPHLHLEISQNVSRRDPARLITACFDAQQSYPPTLFTWPVRCAR